MDIDLIFRIAAIGILVSVLNQVLSRSGREEQATMTTLAGLVVAVVLAWKEKSLLTVAVFACAAVAVAQVALALVG